jgi:tetratricopeptide (TPR) repeat protein
MKSQTLGLLVLLLTSHPLYAKRHQGGEDSKAVGRKEQNIPALIKNCESALKAGQDYSRSNQIDRKVFELLDGCLKETHPCLFGIQRQIEDFIYSMPKVNKDLFLILSSPLAKELLKKAKDSNDPELLKEVIHRYPGTESASEAMGLLAAYYMDRGHFEEAQLYFDELMKRDPSRFEKDPKMELARQRVAVRLGKMPKADASRLKEIDTSSGKKIDVEDLVKEIEKIPTGKITKRNEDQLLQCKTGKSEMEVEPLLEGDRKHIIEALQEKFRFEPRFVSKKAFAFTAKQVAMGNFHACAITFEDKVKCWGNTSSKPEMASKEKVKQIIASGLFSCAITLANEVECWGGSPSITAKPFKNKIKQIVAGSNHICALTLDDYVTCSGISASKPESAPKIKVKQLVANGDQSCAITIDDEVKCWGDPDSKPESAPKGKMKKIVAGTKHNCAITFEDEVKCWGRASSLPEDAPKEKVKQLTANGDHSCAITRQDTVKCWGEKDYNNPSNATKEKVKQLASGWYHTCAITTNDEIRCWGHPGTEPSNPPRDKVKKIIAGGYNNCAITEEDEVKCWGLNRELRQFGIEGSQWCLNWLKECPTSQTK